MSKKIVLAAMFFCAGISLKTQPLQEIYYNYGNTVNLSYFGEHLFHPGLRLGYEIPALHNKIVKPRKTSHSLMLHPGIGYYKHVYNHSALFLNMEAGYNILFFFGLEGRINLGVGYLRTFLDGEVYEMKEDGTFKKVPLAGNNTFMPSLSLHLGYDFSRLTESKLGFFIKPSIFFQIPYNDFVLPQYSVEIGLKYHLSKRINKFEKRSITNDTEID